MVHIGKAYGIECAEDVVQTHIGSACSIRNLSAPPKGYNTSVALANTSKASSHGAPKQHNEFVVYEKERCLPLFMVEYVHREGVCQCGKCPIDVSHS